MRSARILVGLFAVLGLVAGCASMPGAGGSGRVAPILDRILAKNELVVGTAASMPPLNMTTKDGQIIGMEPDLARVMAGALGVKLTLKPVPFSELIAALESGGVDVVLSGMTITPARNLKVAFVGPYYVSGKSILTKTATLAAAKHVSHINTPATVLAALRGSTSQLFVERLIPKATLVLTDNYDQAVAMVLENRVHALVADHPICTTSVLRYPDKGLIALANPISYEPIGVALPANDALFVNWIQNFLGTLEKSGELEVLRRRWFDDSSWVSRLP
jgi:polar amino acid transport system substrate-binding protein